MNLKRVLWTALTIIMLVLTAAFLRPVTSVVMAQADKVGICHRTGSGYVFIKVHESAESAHIGDDAHPPIDGREDFFADGPGDCGVTTTTTTTTCITTATVTAITTIATTTTTTITTTTTTTTTTTS
jgi:hypothetical protein